MNISHLLVFLQFFSLGLLFLPFNVQVLPYSLEVKNLFLLLAVLLFIWVVFHNKLGNFNIVPEIKEGCKLVTSGPYKYIRHPMYTGVMLIALAEIVGAFAFWKLLVLFVLVVVLYLKASREENFWCAKTQEYENLKKHTKMFIPFVL